MSLTSLFLEHPRSVGESYGQHMRVALAFAGWLALASLCAVVHAVVPALFTKTAGGIITRLHRRMTVRQDAPPEA